MGIVMSMSTAAVDTHAFVKRLAQAGMPEKQAEVLVESQAQMVEALTGWADGRFATKQDLKDMELRLRHDMGTLELRLMVRLGSMMVIAIGVVATLVKLL